MIIAFQLFFLSGLKDIKIREKLRAKRKKKFKLKFERYEGFFSTAKAIRKAKGMHVHLAF